MKGILTLVNDGCGKTKKREKPKVWADGGVVVPLPEIRSPQEECGREKICPKVAIPEFKKEV